MSTKTTKEVFAMKQLNNGPQKAKVINMVQSHPLDRKRKTIITDEGWMNVPIIFPPIPARDLLEEALVVEAEVEEYLVQRIHIDEGASVEIMFEHCFNMLHPSFCSRLVETQTTVSGFLREQVKPLGKIELDVCFGGSERCRRAIMKFTIIPAPLPYNIILGRPGLKQLRAVPSPIHGTMKFPTPWGVATVVSQTPVVLECRNERKKQAVEPSKMVSTTQKVVEKEHRHFRMGTVGYDRKIDSKIEAVMGFPLKCFLDAYKGYHQVQMADEDEEKTAFYIDQGTYCYTKMSFGLKNAGATYQRLVDEAFQSQIRKNLEVYVDQMVVKSKTERGMLADIAETFDNLRKINMKLNPNKCSFGVTKGKFLGTWGEMQILAGKLAALNRFLSRSAEKSLPFFKTLKDITKKNKHDYHWIEKAESAFHELKKMVLDLPALTTPLPKKNLFVYLAASQEAVSAVLLVIRKGRKHPVHYVSRTLHDAERNSTPLEKMALALRHVSRRLRRYFEAHHIIVITNQPIKQVLSKADTTGRLAPYSVELAAYNIKYEPHNAVKGKILADFINEVPVGNDAMVPRPTKTEYTYVLRLNFESTNNQAEYEALLAGLRIVEKIGVQSLSVNVDSKLVANQISETLDVSSMDIEEINAVVEEEGETWMTPIINCLEKGIDVLGPLPEAPGKIRETPYSLTFGSEAVIPAEIGMPTHRTMMIKEGSGNEEEMRLNLDLLTERREAVAIREARYKEEQYYNKRVRPMSFKVGEHVYQKNEASRVENLGKLGPKWEGSYLIREAYKMDRTSCVQ
nr:reverse transcriptase domain-containing protein [Tanacetum cinerariifolium]